MNWPEEVPQAVRNILSLADLSSAEIKEIIHLGQQLKKRGRTESVDANLVGRTIAMIFDKPSTRTRVSFEVAAIQLGAHPVFMSGKDLQLGRGETLGDTARTLSRYVDAVVIRTFSHENLVTFAEAASIPVVNALSDDFHPCQVLADLMTLEEHKGELADVHLAYIGDGNNVCNDLVLGAVAVGVDLRVATPAGYEPRHPLVVNALASKDEGQRIDIQNNARVAVRDADAIYTDVWASMGQENAREKRLEDFAEFQVNADLLVAAKPDAVVMHCLPAHRGEEITSDVLDGDASIVFDQAENRLHVQKALLKFVFSKRIMV